MTDTSVHTLVHALLDAGGRTYEQIAEEVRRQLPEARTTARSVASHAVSWRRKRGRTPELRARAPDKRSAIATPTEALPAPDLDAVGELIAGARRVACDYYRLTGRPLGVTGEVGEYEAALRLGLRLAPARAAGFDATDEQGRRLQVKTRSLGPEAKPGQRLGGIKLKHPWDAVLLVLLDQNLEAVEIWEASRDAITAALLAPGSKARNERGALAVSKFKAIGYKRWLRS